MDIIEILKVIFLGIVEGITEWLPISSTGHMILVNEFLQLDCSPEFWEFFEVVIQLGAIMAVVVIYFKKIWPFSLNKSKGIMNHGPLAYIKRVQFVLWLKIIIACIPAAVIGILFDDVFEELFYHPIPIAIALIVFGVAFIVVERWNKVREPKITRLSKLGLKEIIVIGLFQVIAAIYPGTSRSGATIIGALLVGVSRPVAADFTFFLAIPVMFGASLLKVIKLGLAFSAIEFVYLGVGCLVAFVVSIVTIKFLLSYIRRNDFTSFGIYRILLGIAVLVYFIGLA